MVTLISDHAKQKAPAQADEDCCYWSVTVLQVWAGEQGWLFGGHFFRKGIFSWFLVTDFIPNCKMKQNIHRWLSHKLLGRCSQKERFMISYFTFCRSLSPHFGSSRREASWRVWKRALYTPQLPQFHRLPGTYPTYDILSSGEMEGPELGTGLQMPAPLWGGRMLYLFWW